MTYEVTLRLDGTPDTKYRIICKETPDPEVGGKERL